jgi:hypothetical protein
MTKSAICCQDISRYLRQRKDRRIRTILEPTATLRDNINLPLTETVTAVTCSGIAHLMLGCRKMMMTRVRDDLRSAFPTIGKRIRATNVLLMWPLWVRPLIEPTRDSEVIAIAYFLLSALRTVRRVSHRRTTVTTAKRTMAVRMPIRGTSMSSSSMVPFSTEHTSR